MLNDPIQMAAIPINIYHNLSNDNGTLLI